MASFILDVIVDARRTDDAVRQIRTLPMNDRDKKALLTEWFWEHGRATKDRGVRHDSYDKLLGRAGNQRLGGGTRPYYLYDII